MSTCNGGARRPHQGAGANGAKVQSCGVLTITSAPEPAAAGGTDADRAHMHAEPPAGRVVRADGPLIKQRMQAETARARWPCGSPARQAEPSYERPAPAPRRAVAGRPHLARRQAGAVQRLLDGREHDELRLLARGAHGDLRRLVLDRCAPPPRAPAPQRRCDPLSAVLLDPDGRRHDALGSSGARCTGRAHTRALSACTGAPAPARPLYAPLAPGPRCAAGKPARCPRHPRRARRRGRAPSGRYVSSPSPERSMIFS